MVVAGVAELELMSWLNLSEGRALTNASCAPAIDAAAVAAEESEVVGKVLTEEQQAQTENDKG